MAKRLRTTDDGPLTTDQTKMPRKPTTPAPPLLLAGPYAPPSFELGSSLVCKLRGRVNVRGVSTAPIAWPTTYGARAGGGGSSRPSLIITAELDRAIRTESREAIVYWWGVDPRTVTAWRAALGVGRMTAGTTARWSALANQRLHGGKKAGAARSKKPATDVV